MKVALIHDHLAQDGGAERVLGIFHKIFPEAPIFVLVHDPQKVNKIFKDADIRTSFIQKMPLGLARYQWYLPLMPQAIESYNLSDYDLVLSSASAFAKGVITHPQTLHICYCHTPTRFLWSDTHSYTRELKYNRLVKKFIPNILHKIRLWDRLAADRVDKFIANSENIACKIKKYYRRDSTVIYAPVDTKQFYLAKNIGHYFLTGGRLVAYKKFDLAIRVFNKLGWPLKIFGSGPEEKKLKKMARPNIDFLGKISDNKLASLYAQAKAFIFPQEEDLGITALESMAAGRPVIAFARGGALETVIPGETGILFSDQSAAGLEEAVRNFDEKKFDPVAIRAQALRFDASIFEQKIREFINESFSAFGEKKKEIKKELPKEKLEEKGEAGKVRPLSI